MAEINQDRLSPASDFFLQETTTTPSKRKQPEQQNKQLSLTPSKRPRFFRSPSPPPPPPQNTTTLTETPQNTTPSQPQDLHPSTQKPSHEPPLFIQDDKDPLDDRKPEIIKTQSQFIDLTCSPDPSPTKDPSPSWEKKYLGGFMCEGYLIFSSARLREGDTVWLSRSRPNGAGPKKLKSISAKKEDHVVRLENKKNGAFARLNETFAKWIVKLIDHHLIHFEGTLMFPPAKGSIGDTVHCYLKAYIFKSALVSPSHKMFDSLKNIQKPHLSHFATTTEVGEEKERMDKQECISKLFDTIGLVPSSASRAGQTKETQPKIEQDPDGEGLIGHENIDLVYQNATAAESALDLQSPCDGFELVLRPYQQQGLSWLMKMETQSDLDLDQAAIYPLWEEYIFPIDQDQANCHTDSTETFYYNPYMGELSYEFPRASEKCQGGILADEMGLGKTIQMAALICTARPPDHALVMTKAARRPAVQPELNDEDDEDDYQPAPASKKLIRHSLQNGAQESVKTKHMPRKSHATLVVCPLTLIDQWKDELERCHKALKVFVYHSASKDEIESNHYDVIITTYGIAANEWGTIESKSPEAPRLRGIFKFDWYRIILDEGHNIRNRNALASRACYNLSGERRWIISGTPIVNRLEDLSSLLHFIRLEPWGNFSFYKSFVTVPFTKKDPKALIVVQTIIESVLLRREKGMKDMDGNPIVSLPPKHVSLAYLELNRKERMIYDLVYSNAKSEYLEYLGQGTVLSNVTAILAILMRLRQAVLHPILVLKKMKIKHARSATDSKIIRQMLTEYERSSENSFAASQLKDLENKLLGQDDSGDEEAQECVMCLDVMDSRVYLPCMHAFCKDCIMAYIESKAGEKTICPSCTAPFQETGIVEYVINRAKKPPAASSQPPTPAEDPSPAEAPSPADGEEAAAADDKLDGPPVLDTIDLDYQLPITNQSNCKTQEDQTPTTGYLKRNDFISSTKLEALVSHLTQVRQVEPGFSAVVFSQFTQFLDLIELVLARDRFRFVRLDGSLTPAKRKNALAAFNQPGRPCILVCSLKVAGVGLNLIKANRVYMMDTWWNEAIENQAIDRIHRFGQAKPTHVVRFLASKTIEDRMLAIQRLKTRVIENALAGASSAAGQPQTLDNLQAIFAD